MAAIGRHGPRACSQPRCPQMSKQPPPHNSELPNPVPQQPSANLSQDDLADQVRHQRREPIQRNLSALAKQFGIDPQAPDVCARLATAMTPTRPKRTTGRKPTWLAGLGAALRKDLQNTKAQFHCSDNEAARRLSKDKSTLWCKYPPQTLTARYRDECRRRRDALRGSIAVLVMCQELVIQNTDRD